MFLNRIYQGKYKTFLPCNLLFSRLSHTEVTELFVPKINFQPNTNVYFSRLRDFVERNHRLLVVTGAGISTESGIRDYRSEGVGLYAVSNSRPVHHQEFIRCAHQRQRYWARNYAAWPVFSSHQPNGGHYVLAELERVGKVNWTVTQNVDSLHSKAGSKRLTELHGSSSRVICLTCGTTTTRDDLQRRLKKLNPTWYASPDVSAPDGDVLLSDDLVKDFQIPNCSDCGGIIKPDMVFFGDNVPKDTVNLVWKHLKESEAVLVLGSSLQVYSAYRFMVAAHELRKPLAIVNIGLTRADHLASLKVEAKIGEIVDMLYNCTEANKSLLS